VPTTWESALVCTALKNRLSTTASINLEPGINAQFSGRFSTLNQPKIYCVHHIQQIQNKLSLSACKNFEPGSKN
jgi:hypothetical protein